LLERRVMVSPPRCGEINSDSVVITSKRLPRKLIFDRRADYPPISGFFMEPALLVRIAQEFPARV